jgi:hypothetical protein
MWLPLTPRFAGRTNFPPFGKPYLSYGKRENA